ncbi:MAG: toll/interleukin-1 receptor domain-containing protein [Verrucomicrobiae bacterium]
MATDAATDGSDGFENPGIWDALLAYIEAGKVIPIIGPDLLVVESGGSPILLDKYLAGELAGKFNLKGGSLPEEPGLSDVVCEYLKRGGRREMLYVRVREILNEAAFPPPRPLVQLAEIAGAGPDVCGFSFFVTTTFDTFLEEALNSVRFGGRPVTDSISYAPNDIKDIPSPLARLEKPLVYHLLGKVSALPTYVISEEDMLEFVCAFQSKETQPKLLFDELERHSLLLLGRVSLPGWPILFLRTARRRRLSNPRDDFEILASNCGNMASDSVAFLHRYSSSTQIFQLGGAVEFVDTLWRMWKERHPESAVRPLPAAAADSTPPPEAMAKDAVFISYAREDLQAVLTLKAGLEAAGLTVWFDFERLGAGDDYDLMIRNNIRNCSIFLPVISAHTEARSEGYFRREWTYALDREKGIFSGVPFIIPVVVDGTRDPRAVPPRFKDFNFSWLPGGDVPSEFARNLTAARKPV